jgi:hypothetical protein
MDGRREISLGKEEESGTRAAPKFNRATRRERTQTFEELLNGFNTNKWVVGQSGVLL